MSDENKKRRHQTGSFHHSSFILHHFPALLLTALLLLLAFRLTSTESLRETISQKSYRLAAEGHPTPDNPIPLPIIGPAFTAAYASLTLLLAGAATLLAARTHLLSPRRIAQFLLLAGTLALLFLSTLHAANRLDALTGALDIATSLAAAWTLLLLCNDTLLGNRARHALFAAILALLAMGAAKAILQHFLEFPDMADYIQHHPVDALRAQGINPDDPTQVTLFMSRVKSAEVSGFGALSNVYATQTIAFVALLTALLIAGIHLLKKALPVAAPQPDARPKRTFAYASSQTHTPREVSLPLLAFIAISILLLAGLFTLAKTESKGGTAAAILAILLIALGGLFWKQVIRWRKPLLLIASAATFLAAIAIIHYGRTHDSLPSRSLLYRWHYWTASVPIIGQHSAWGVGLNNFGDYYLQTKRPSSPEDVKDPHNFFIRLLAETGYPVTLALSALLLLFLYGVFRPPTPSKADSQTSEGKGALSSFIIHHSSFRPLLLAAAVALLWIPLHLAFAEDANDYNAMLACLYALLGWLVFAAIYPLLSTLESHPTAPLRTRYLTLAAAVAALAMLLYDQVNMALVTGPVAMLFWMLLALADSHDPAPLSSEPQSKIKNQKSKILALAAPLLAASLTSLIALTIPLFTGTFPWDPAPQEFEYIRQLNANRPDLALSALDAALSRSPNSIELHMQKVTLLREGFKPPLPAAGEIRRILSLDHTNAKPRIMLALPDSNLPPRERITALEQALQLDQALPPGEPKHLTPEQITQIESKIRELEQLNH